MAAAIPLHVRVLLTKIFNDYSYVLPYTDMNNILSHFFHVASFPQYCNFTSSLIVFTESCYVMWHQKSGNPESENFKIPASKSPPPRIFLTLPPYGGKKNRNCLRIKNFQIKSFGFADSEISYAMLNRTVNNAGSSGSEERGRGAGQRKGVKGKRRKFDGKINICFIKTKLYFRNRYS